MTTVEHIHNMAQRLYAVCRRHAREATGVDLGDWERLDGSAKRPFLLMAEDMFIRFGQREFSLRRAAWRWVQIWGTLVNEGEDAVSQSDQIDAMVALQFEAFRSFGENVEALVREREELALLRDYYDLHQILEKGGIASLGLHSAAVEVFAEATVAVQRFYERGKPVQARGEGGE